MVCLLGFAVVSQGFMAGILPSPDGKAVLPIENERRQRLRHLTGGPCWWLSHADPHRLRAHRCYMDDSPVELVPKLPTVQPLLADQSQPRK